MRSESEAPSGRKMAWYESNVDTSAMKHNDGTERTTGFFQNGDIVKMTTSFFAFQLGSSLSDQGFTCLLKWVPIFLQLR